MIRKRGYGMDRYGFELWPEWKVVRKIGSGSFGNVYEIHRRNGSYLEKAALKVLRIPSSQKELLQLRGEGLEAGRTEEYFARHVDEIRNEIGVMQKFVGYSNIVSYEDYLIRKHKSDIGWDILIRMELLTPLSDYMINHPMSEKLVLKMGMDISQALVILHGGGVIHRDIKPQNIFINDRGFFKLGDFGISRNMPQSQREVGRSALRPHLYVLLRYTIRGPAHSRRCRDANGGKPSYSPPHGIR